MFSPVWRRHLRNCSQGHYCLTPRTAPSQPQIQVGVTELELHTPSMVFPFLVLTYHIHSPLTNSLPSPLPQPHSRPSTIRSFLIVHMFSGWRSVTAVRIALVVLQPDVNSFLDFPLTLPSVSVIVTTLKKSFWD